ncbi:hypothetical protein C8R44DRAFT_754728 [Mycena epipterygia]|nr:hypothetical protein C8R44DRAFT_754728 [Mycena epipterygia]
MGIGSVRMKGTDQYALRQYIWVIHYPGPKRNVQNKSDRIQRGITLRDMMERIVGVGPGVLRRSRWTWLSSRSAQELKSSPLYRGLRVRIWEWRKWDTRIFKGRRAGGIWWTAGRGYVKSDPAWICQASRTRTCTNSDAVEGSRMQHGIRINGVIKIQVLSNSRALYGGPLRGTSTQGPGLAAVECGRTGEIRIARARRSSEPGTQTLDQEEILNTDIQQARKRFQTNGGSNTNMPVDRIEANLGNKVLGPSRGLQGLEQVEGVIFGSLESRGVYLATLGAEWNARADPMGAIIKSEIFEEDLKKPRKTDSTGLSGSGC